MLNNKSLARWCALAGFAGIVLGIIGGIIGLMNPAAVYAVGETPFNFTTSLGKTMALIYGLCYLGFTASFLGYYLVGAAGDGLLGKVGTVITAIGNAGGAVGFFLSAITGSYSPVTYIAFILLIGFPLLTIAALRAKKVSALKAWAPVLVMIGITILEMGFSINGFVDMAHQFVYGAISFVVWNEANKA